MTVERAWSVEGFHHVQLWMPLGREDDAESFYSGLLGFEEGFAPSAKAHPAVRVRGLMALRGALLAADIAVEDDIQLEGHDRWYVRDPFGNRLESIEEVAG